MLSPQMIVGPLLWDRMVSAFRSWIKNDRFGEPNHFQNLPMFKWMSVREMIGDALYVGNRYGLWHGNNRVRGTLEMTVGELLKRDIATSDDGRIGLGYIFEAGLCSQHIGGLMTEATTVRGGRADAEKEWGELLKSTGCKDWEEVEKRLTVLTNVKAMSHELMKIFKNEVADKKLWDFYKCGLGENGFMRWWPRAWSGVGTEMKTSIVGSARGELIIRVSRYEGDGIRAYEWCAELKSSLNDESPLAAANGMVYVLPRLDGYAMCTSSDLCWAADTVADADVAQVMAFIKQHEDAEDRMDAGDLVFLWLWERSNRSEPGDGELVLKAALNDLKKRFRGIKTLIASIDPAQFQDISLENDPPEFLNAKHEAYESLGRYLEVIEPEKCIKGEMRLISSRADSAGETLASLLHMELEESGYFDADDEEDNERF